jgi:hypothetical protein
MIETYSDEKVGVLPENVHLKDHVMVGLVRFGQRSASVPVRKGDRTIRTEKINVAIAEDYGAQSLVDEDLLIQRQIRSGIDFNSIPHKGGHILDFGSVWYYTRKAKPFEFHSLNAYLSRENNTIHNNTFVQQTFYKDWFAANPVSQWRMPFSPESVSNFAVSWQMIDADGGKWECVAPQLQKPNWIPRLTHFGISNPKADSVNIVEGSNPGYDEATHSFIVQPGCRIRLFFINSPMGQKEFSDEVEFDLDTNTIKLI